MPSPACRCSNRRRHAALRQAHKQTWSALGSMSCKFREFPDWLRLSSCIGSTCGGLVTRCTVQGTAPSRSTRSYKEPIFWKNGHPSRMRIQHWQRPCDCPGDAGAALSMVPNTIFFPAEYAKCRSNSGAAPEVGATQLIVRLIVRIGNLGFRAQLDLRRVPCPRSLYCQAPPTERHFRPT
jgi:hypothetical protein